MKFEDLKDQSSLDAALAAAIATAVEGLKTKNDEILGKLAAAKENMAPDDLAALQQAAIDLKTLKDGQLEEQGEYKKLLDTARAQHAEAIKAITDKFNTSEAQVKHLMVNDGLAKALGAHNVNPVLLDAAISLLSGDVTLTDLDGKKTAQVGDKSLNDYVSDWASSDVGKNFTLAGGNTGGGAGGNGGANTPDDIAKAFTHAGWNITEQAKLYNSDKDKYTQLHEKFPVRPDAPQLADS